jgi:TonB family protein
MTSVELLAPHRSRWAAVLDPIRDGINRAAAALAPFDGIAVGFWILGSTVLFAAYVAGQWTLRRRRRHWREAKVCNVSVLVAPDTGPAVVGAWMPRIVIPEWVLALDQHQIELLIRHEIEHQRAHDARLLHLAGLALVAMPWNPAAWWILSRLRVAVEVDCDARVISEAPITESPAVRHAYGELLLAVATRMSVRPSPFTPTLLEHPSALNRRLSAMYPEQRRFPKMRVLATSVIAFGLVAATLAAPVPSAARASQGDRVYGETTKNLVLPKPTKQVHPNYTPEAMQHKIQGVVEISAVVEKDGSIGEPEITKSLDKTYGLDESALAAIKQWTFEPGRLDNQIVRVHVSLTLSFKLH